MAKGHHDGTRLAHVEIFLSMKTAMFSRRYVKRQGILGLKHDAISAGVHPTLFRILGDYEIVGTDVTSAVQFVPARNRKRFQVDIFLDTILENRRVLHIFRFHGLEIADFLPPRLDEIRCSELGIGPHGQSQSLDSVDLTAKDLYVLAGIGNFLEEQSGRMLAALQNHLEQSAHVFIPGNPLDSVQLVDGVNFFHPGA